jgi:RNA-directed DNA polymerase
LEGDIKGCFDHISHQWLLDNIPVDKVMLNKWLKCGFVFNKKLFPTSEGTPQGGIISPTLANMTLDGFQSILRKKYPYQICDKSKGKKYSPRVNFGRYADDFIITADSKEILDEIKPVVQEFLLSRGLTLSDEKTKITHIDDGFDFLGYNFRKYKGKLLIKPSKKGVKKFLDKVRGHIKDNKACKQEVLIGLLNPVVVGWANYYKNCVASHTFRYADHFIFLKLWQWAVRRHSNKSKEWIMKKYFSKIDNDKWCFTPDNKDNNRRIVLKKLADTKITKYVKIKSEANPFDNDWREYFEKRRTYKMMLSLNGRRNLLSLWKKQNKVCPVCGSNIDSSSSWRLSDKILDGKSVKYLIHNRCRSNSPILVTK